MWHSGIDMPIAGPLSRRQLLAFASVAIALFACEDDAFDDAGAEARSTEDSSMGCVQETFDSTARPGADWGFTDGAEQWTGYRVAEEASGVELGCADTIPDMDSGRYETVPGEWLPMRIEAVNGGRLIVFTGEARCQQDWQTPLRVTGCGFVSYVSTWRVSVYDLTTGCLIGTGEETDGPTIVRGCDHSPVVVGSFPPACADERIEGWCAQASTDADAGADRDSM